MTVIQNKNKKKKNIRKWAFYTAIVSVPVLQMILMYFCVNINSFLMAFRRYDINTGEWYWNGINNFERVLYDLTTLPVFKYGIKNSVLAWFWTSLVSIFLGLIFANYIFRRNKGWGFFRVVLFLPSVLSASVLISIFRYYGDRFLPGIINQIFGTDLMGFLSTAEYKLPTIIAFTIFISFGTQVLLFTGAMTAIPESVFDAGKIDGATPLKEFFLIIIPQIVPTVSVFLVSGIASMFSNQLHLYTFYIDSADIPVQTIGYYTYRAIKKATSYAEYPYIATIGLLCTTVVAPLVWFAKWAFKKLDPMED